MPFINGRFYINPTYGAALEAAREAEARATAEDSARGDQQEDAASATTPATDAPIRRIEIETTEVVPPHSGHAQRGFVARIHRVSSTTQAGQGSPDSIFGGLVSRAGGATSASPRQTQAPETHVFADHQDLTNFLGAELQRDAER